MKVIQVGIGGMGNTWLSTVLNFPKVEFFKGPLFGGFREEMPYPLIIHMAIHHFDMMRLFLDSDPVSVYGSSWNPAWSWYKGDASAAVSPEFANGVVVSYNGSWCSTGAERPWNANWRFDCENGSSCRTKIGSIPR